MGPSRLRRPPLLRLALTVGIGVVAIVMLVAPRIQLINSKPTGARPSPSWTPKSGPTPSPSPISRWVYKQLGLDGEVEAMDMDDEALFVIYSPSRLQGVVDPSGSVVLRH